MNHSGQPTFSDDPILNNINIANKLIQEGNFETALNMLSELMKDNNIDPDYPGLEAGYRTAKFWFNRKDEIANLAVGKKTADFFMSEWKSFEKYAQEKIIQRSDAYQAVMMYVYYKTSEHYSLSFRNQEDTGNDLELLLNLGSCFLKLGDYQKTVETLEFAARSYNANAKLLSLLGEAYYKLDDLPKSLLYFREAFFTDPSVIDLSMITSDYIIRLIELINEERKNCFDVREWIPVYGLITDTFSERKMMQERQIESIKVRVATLEVNYQKMSKDQIDSSNVLPRLLAGYLCLLDYFEFQNYNFDNISQIRDRLLKIDHSLFENFLNKKRRK